MRITPSIIPNRDSIPQNHPRPKDAVSKTDGPAVSRTGIAGGSVSIYAVFQAAQREIGRRIEARADAVDDPWDQLVAGCRAFLQACTEPVLQQIVVIDAPAVLEWNAYREVDETMPGSGFSLLKEGLQELVDHKVIKPLSKDAVACMLSGAMDEAAVWIARCDDRERALAQAQEALESLLDGLLA